VFKHISVIAALLSGLSPIVEAQNYNSMLGISVSIIDSISTYSGNETAYGLVFPGILFGLEHSMSFDQYAFLGIRSSITTGFSQDGAILKRDDGFISATLDGDWYFYYRGFSDSETALYFRGYAGPSLRFINWGRWQFWFSPAIGAEIVHISWPSISSGGSSRHEERDFSATSTSIIVLADFISTFRVTDRFVVLGGFDMASNPYARLRLAFSDSIRKYDGPSGGRASGSVRAYSGIGYLY
jgi:hypothetical protein